MLIQLLALLRHLYGQRYVVQYKRSDDSRTGTEFYEPISAIILGGIIAGVLRAVRRSRRVLQVRGSQ
eukprot:275541-Amphidinium_carterae.1